MEKEINYKVEYKSLQKAFEESMEAMERGNANVRKLEEENEGLRNSKDKIYEMEEFHYKRVQELNKEVNELREAIIKLVKKL